MKTHFDEAIGTVPAPTVDVDTLIARGRRGTAYRRMALSAAGVGGVAALIAVVVSTGLLGGVVGAGRPAQFGGPGVQASAPAADNAPKSETIKETERRLTEGLRAIVKEQLPEARATYDYPDWKPLEVRYVFHPGSDDGKGKGHRKDDYFQGMAALTDKHGKGEFWMLTGVIGPGFGVDTSCDNFGGITNPRGEVQKGTPNPGSSCTTVKGPRGETIVRQVVTDTIEGPGPQDVAAGRSHKVHISRPDGTGMLLHVNNGPGKDPDPKVNSKEPKLSLDQLVELGTDPRLALRR